MTIETALAHVELRAHEEFRVRQIPLRERVESLSPDEIFRLLAPELFRLLERLFVEREVLVLRLDPRALREVRARLKLPIFFEVRNDGIRHGRVGNYTEVYTRGMSFLRAAVITGGVFVAA